MEESDNINNLLTKSNVKKLVHSFECRVEPEFVELLEKKVTELVSISCLRAKANNRTTVLKRDL